MLKIKFDRNGSETKVDPSLKALMREQTEDERFSLTESMKAHAKRSPEGEGNREAAIVWKGRGIIVDGMNRKEVADGEGFAFKYVEQPFASMAEARRFVLENQLGRRNLDATDFHRLLGQLYVDRRGKGGNAAKEIAEANGTSVSTVKRAGRIADALASLTAGAQKHAATLDDDSILLLAQTPRKQQMALAKELKAAKKGTKAKAELQPKDLRNRMVNKVQSAARDLAEVRKMIGRSSGQKVLAAFDELAKAIERWKVS